MKEPESAQGHPIPNSQHNEISFLQRKKGQGIRDKDRRQRSRKKGKEQGRGEGTFAPDGQRITSG